MGATLELFVQSFNGIRGSQHGPETGIELKERQQRIQVFFDDTYSRWEQRIPSILQLMKSQPGLAFVGGIENPIDVFRKRFALGFSNPHTGISLRMFLAPQCLSS